MNPIRSYSCLDASRFAFNTLKYNYKTVFKLALVYVLILAAIFVLGISIVALAGFSSAAFSNGFLSVGILCIIAITFIALLIAFLFSYYFVWVATVFFVLYDSKIKAILEVRPSLRMYFQILKTNIAVILLMILGFLLFIIPGLIVLFRYGFASIRSLERYSSIKENFKFSRKITSGNIWFIMSQMVTVAICIWLLLFTTALLKMLMAKLVLSVSKWFLPLFFVSYVLSGLTWALSWFFGLLVWIYMYRQLKDNYERTVEQDKTSVAIHPSIDPVDAQ